MTDNATYIIVEALRECVGDGDGADDAVLMAHDRSVRIETMRDIAFSLIDWDVIYGLKASTPETDTSHRIAEWIQTQAAELMEKQGA